MTTQPSGEPVEGTTIAGRYRVAERIGAGGMGIVHRARDTVLDRDVALKQLLIADDDERTGAAARLRREARIAATLHHGRIVSVFDVLEGPTGPLLVMEYVPAPSLGTVIAESAPLPPGATARIGAQVAEALAALHAAGIVHRDVKPGNVLVAGDGPVKLTDFGIARVDGRNSLTASALGTPAYFAPEIARGDEPAPPSDVYALGATLRVATEGEPPFGWAEDSPLALIRRIAAADPVPGPALGGPLGTLLGRMTDADPVVRPSAAEAARLLWELADRDEPVAPPPDEPAGRPGTATGTGAGTGPRPDDPTARPAPGRRARWLLAAAATVAVAAVALAVGLTGDGDAGGGTPPGGGTPGGGTAGVPAATGYPATVPALAVADQRTADPCLFDPAALERFGPATARPDYGNLAACGAEVALSGSDSYEVSLRWRQRSSSPPEGEQRRLGDLIVVGRPADDDSCRRYLVLADGTRAEIDASFYGSGRPAAPPCEVADATAASAARTLAERGVPQRAIPPDPLGTADACALLQPEDLSFLPAPQRADPYRGFAGWTCDWSDGREPELGITLSFDRYDPPSERDDSRPVPGTPAWVREQGQDSCNGEIEVSRFLSSTGRIFANELRVKVEGTGTPEQRCALAGRLVTAANDRLR